MPSVDIGPELQRLAKALNDKQIQEGDVLMRLEELGLALLERDPAQPPADSVRPGHRPLA